MRWLKSDMWKLGIALAGLLLFLVFMVWIPMSAADAQTETSAFATPIVDLTVTALAKEQFTLQVKQLQQNEDRGFGTWLWNNAAAIVASFLSTLVVVIGALIGFWQWRINRNDIRTKESNDRKEAQDKELKDREDTRRKEEEARAKESKDRQAAQDKDLRAQAEERFKTAVAALGDENEGVQVGGAILLCSFIKPGDEEIYGRYYTQIFDLAVAYLRLLPKSGSQDSDTPLPLTPLRLALIVLFKEAFPLARNWLREHNLKNQFNPQSLDASSIKLDDANLRGADLKQIWMPEASLRKTDLKGAGLSWANLYKANLSEASLTGADLSGANLIRANLFKTWFRLAKLDEARLREANLSGVNLEGADLSGAKLTGVINLEDALSLKDTNLRGVGGFSKEQKDACRAKGAIVDGETLTNAPQSAVPPPPPKQSS